MLTGGLWIFFYILMWPCILIDQLNINEANESTNQRHPFLWVHNVSIQFLQLILQSRKKIKKPLRSSTNNRKCKSYMQVTVHIIAM